MSRYSDNMPSWFINAKDLWKMLIQQREENKELPTSFSMNVGINQAVGLLNRLPAADVVEVVRCKDCIRKNEHEDGLMCRVMWLYVKPEDFCSYGKRDENGQG